MPHHHRPLVVAALLVGLVVATAAPLAAQDASPAASPAATPLPGTGTIVGRVTDQTTGQPMAGVYLTVGYKGIGLAAITGADGRYRVRAVPAGQAADVFGFHGGGYRYHNSFYDDHLAIVLAPGQTYTYNFSVKQLNDPAGEPQVADPAMTPTHAQAGQPVTFEVTARGGKGGLSDEVFAASPALGRLAWLRPLGGDRFRGTLSIPPGTPVGDEPVAFFAASNACYDNHDFPLLTLHVDPS
jgi:Carboxypeptidase regulatory-like domain